MMEKHGARRLINFSPELLFEAPILGWKLLYFSVLIVAAEFHFVSCNSDRLRGGFQPVPLVLLLRASAKEESFYTFAFGIHASHSASTSFAR